MRNRPVSRRARSTHGATLRTHQHRMPQYVFQQVFPASESATQLTPTHKCRQLQAMHELTHAIQNDEAVADEAPRQHLASRVTAMLSRQNTQNNEDLLEAISGLLAALSGASLHSCRVVSIEYPSIGAVRVAEGALGDGVGARLWGISHRFNLNLIENSAWLEGANVLEVGSGVGSTGVVAAQLGAQRVVMTDVVTSVLHTLRRTMHLNAGQLSAAAAAGSGTSQGDAAQELQFSDADTVSSEGDLLAPDSSDGFTDNSIHAGGQNSQSESYRAADNRTGEAEQWRTGNMQIRFLDWSEEWRRLPEHVRNSAAASSAARAAIDETTSALDHLTVDQRSLSHDDEQVRDSTFDEPSSHADLPPGLPPDETFEVVLGCEVLYELPHAKWLAATLQRRLARGGRAEIIGAVRDIAVRSPAIASSCPPSIDAEAHTTGALLVACRWKSFWLYMRRALQHAGILSAVCQRVHLWHFVLCAQVYESFEWHLKLLQLQFTWQPVYPVMGFSGAPIGNKADAYEAGFRHYVIQH